MPLQLQISLSRVACVFTFVYISYRDRESPPRHTPMRGGLLKSARAVAMAQVERIIQVLCSAGSPVATVLYPIV